MSSPDPQWTKRSPLRYPGGKTRAVKVIRDYFPKGIRELTSPFLGGGSIELSLAAEGVRVYGYDAFAPLVEFWQHLLTEPEVLAREVECYYPLAKDDFYALQRNQHSLTSSLLRGAAFYVLNRASFSGSTLSGGMSPGHPRFTVSSIERIRAFSNPNLTVEVADFKDSLLRQPDRFAYCDPPYWIKSALYGKKGNTHRDFDHEGLAEVLHRRSNWVLSYNDCPEIRQLYSRYPIVTPQWTYGMSKNKTSSEVLILSLD